MTGEWRRDGRQGFRALRLRPGASLAVVVTVALAIGATTSVFSVVDGVLLRPLPYPEPGRLARAWQTKGDWFDSPNSQLRAFADRLPLSTPTFNDWTRADIGFESLGAYYDGSWVRQGVDGAEVIRGRGVTSGYFTVLGIEPILGRRLLPADDIVGVAANVQHQGLAVDVEPKLYIPAAQSGRATNAWVLRVRGDVPASIDLARAAVSTQSPTTPVRGVEVLEETISDSVAVPRFRTFFVAGLSGLAATLALLFDDRGRRRGGERACGVSACATRGDGGPRECLEQRVTDRDGAVGRPLAGRSA